MDQMAEAIAMDPLEFRLKNAQETGEVTGQGMVFRSCGFQECLRTAAERSDFQRKHREYAARQRDTGALQARHRHCFDAARGRRREDLSVGRLRHHPQAGRLRAPDADHRCLRNRPGLGDGADATGLRGARPADVRGDRDQQRHRHHALGRRRARQPHHLHRRQLGARRGAPGQGQDPGGRGRQVRVRGRHAGPEGRTHRARRHRRAPQRPRPVPAQPALQRPGRTGDDQFLLRAAQHAPGQGLQGRRVGGLRVGHPDRRGRGRHRHRRGAHGQGDGSPRRRPRAEPAGHRRTGRRRHRHGPGLRADRKPGDRGRARAQSRTSATTSW